MTYVGNPVPLLARVLVTGCLALGLSLVVLQSPAAAAAWGASQTTDTPVGQCAPGFINASIREAVCSTEANPGADAILVSAGTYTLTNGPIPITQDLTIARIGAGAVTIDGGGGPVFDIADGVQVNLRFFQIAGADTGYAVTAGSAGGSPTTLNLESMSFTGNTGGAVKFTGGALTIGLASGSTTASSFTNNSSPSGGGAVSFTATGAGQGLTVGNTTFSGNSAASQYGGAVQVTSQPGVTTQINNSRFFGNTVTGTGGGALGQTSGSLTVARSSFSGNTANGAGAVGGAILATALGSATLNYDRFAGNTSTTGADVHTAVAGTVDAEHNWFGCNGGPGSLDCDTISGAPGAVDASPWLVFDGSGPSTVDGPDGTGDVEAGVTYDSDGVAVAVNDRGAFQGVGVAWSDPLPSPSTVSPASSNMASGLADAVYDSESAPAGPGSVTATLDNQSIVIPFDVRLRPIVTDDPDDLTVAVGGTATFTAAATGDPTPTVQWESSTNGSTWDPIPSATDPTLSFTAVAGDDGKQYRAVFTNVADSDTTAPATLTIGTAPAFTSADSTTFTIGTTGTFTVTTTGDPAPAISSTGALPTGVTFTDNGDGTATLAGTPAAGTAGDYDLDLHTGNVLGDDDQDFTLTVAKAAQSVTFTTSPPSGPNVGATYPVAATATSGLTAALSAGPGGVCTIAAGTVTFTGVGTCAISADQAGDGTYATAVPVTQLIGVAALVPDLTLALPDSPSVYGQPVRAHTVIAGALSGEVQYFVDDLAVGGRVPVVDGEATSPVLTDPEGAPLEPGSYDVAAVFFPADPAYAATRVDTTHVVRKAATTVDPAVDPTTVSATVMPVAPGVGVPTGDVELWVDGVLVGTVPLEDGVATLEHVVEPGGPHAVSATYAGDDRFTESSGSAARLDPTITARVISPVRKSAYGWYRQPVTVRFTCTTQGAPLLTPCPGPVRVRHNTVRRAVAGTVLATDGGAAATAVVVRLDTVTPRLVVRGLHGSHQRPRCTAHDQLSGVASCRIFRSHVASDGRVRFLAVAVDRAGNRTVLRGHYWNGRAHPGEPPRG